MEEGKETQLISCLEQFSQGLPEAEKNKTVREIKILLDELPQLAKVVEATSGAYPLHVALECECPLY